MSSADNELRPLMGAILPSVDLAAVRALLRAERKKRKWSLDDLARESGVNRSTIQDIETNAHGKPQLGTVGRLIEAMPPLTLSQFFAQLEDQTNTDLRRLSESTTTAAIPHARAASYPEEFVDGGPLPAPDDPEVLQAIARVYARRADRVRKARQTRSTAQRKPGRG